MEKNNFSIIGAGITGLISAFILKKYKKKVKVFEISNKPGGIINDVPIEKNDGLLSGCQFFPRDSFWIKMLPLKVRNNLVEQNFYSYCFCDLFNKRKKFIKNYPDIFTDYKLDLSKFKKIKKPKNLTEKINLYPKKISNPLMKWVKRFKINTNELMTDSHRQGLMFSRLYPIQNKQEIYIKKKESIFFNDIYGLPNYKNTKIFFKGLMPKNGFQSFFELIKEDLQKKGTIFKFLSPVKINYKDNKFSIMSKGIDYSKENILWTGNPVPLIINYNRKKLDSVNFKIRIINFELKKKFKNPFYVQIFSKKSSVCRIFLYRKMKKYYACVECFDEREKVSDILKFSNKLLKKHFNLSLNSKPLVDKVRKRYSLLTKQDFKTIKSFKINTIKTNLISYPWEIYSREGKLEEVKKKLHKFL
tara:strand:+ start:15297 stop:16544 length:1248 start_codon:yes stop_codon:yes gene_type:complete